jgi:hypothetical protein
MAHEDEHFPGEIPDCVDKDNATQKKINALKKKYCESLTASYDNVGKLEVAYWGKEAIYKKKERKYLRTLRNLNRYVNTEISLGSQLMEANKRLTANVASYKAWDDGLADNLKKFFDSVKDLKSKVGDLREAGCKIDNSMTDSCSSGKWAIITGKNPDTCKDEQTPTPHEGCKDAEKIIELLICMPKALYCDVDSIFKASSDIIGIQKFGNIGSLVALQTDLSAKTTDLDTLLQTVIATRKKDLETAQKDLVQSLSDRTDSIVDVYGGRCDYDGLYRTVSQICCPICGCVQGKENCEARLDECLCRICNLCAEVKNTFSDLVGTTQTTARS